MIALNPLHADFSTTTFFVVLMDVNRGVTKFLSHHLQVESFALKCFSLKVTEHWKILKFQEVLLGHAGQWFTGLGFRMFIGLIRRINRHQITWFLMRNTTNVMYLHCKGRVAS
ncbi:hypothetical protein MKX03_016358 [Papaver bracteatum]|nr:hypothetical protein MKX03_016358 [Papaver bracteatum]